MTDEQVTNYRHQLRTLLFYSLFSDIQISGVGAPRPVKTFEQMGFDDIIMKSLFQNQFSAPTPIQAQAIPCIMAGRDLIGIAKTGSGKTLSFILPMIIHILDQRKKIF
jgi:superfamily II DNA/RNA helicase